VDGRLEHRRRRSAQSWWWTPTPARRPPEQPTGTFPGDLELRRGTLAMNAAGGTVILRGNLALDGTLRQNGRVLRFGGGATQTIAAAGAPRLDAVQLAKGGGSVRLTSPLTIAGTLDFGGAVDVLDLGDQTLTLLGTIGGANPSGALKGGPAARLRGGRKRADRDAAIRAGRRGARRSDGGPFRRRIGAVRLDRDGERNAGADQRRRVDRIRARSRSAPRER
jgi:hypothetical protein